MTEPTPETLSTIAKAVRNWRLVRLNRSWLDEHARRLDGCASAWEADRARIEALEHDAEHLRSEVSGLMLEGGQTTQDVWDRFAELGVRHMRHGEWWQGAALAAEER